MTSDSSLPSDISYIDNEDALRALHKKPLSRATDKVLHSLDGHCKAIIARSPFCIISTQGPDGADVSPRGDPPGFVKVLNNTHLLLPDRIGNNRLDNAANLLTNPAIGMLFLVPGMNETLRINGYAKVTDDSRLLEPLSVKNKAPMIGFLIEIGEAYLHCAKALFRANLWDPERHMLRSDLPSFSEMLIDQCEDLSREECARQDKIMAERGLY